MPLAVEMYGYRHQGRTIDITLLGCLVRTSLAVLFRVSQQGNGGKQEFTIKTFSICYLSCFADQSSKRIGN